MLYYDINVTFVSPPGAAPQFSERNCPVSCMICARKRASALRRPEWKD